MSQIDLIAFIPALTWFAIFFVCYYLLNYALLITQAYFIIRLRAIFFHQAISIMFGIFKRYIYFGFYANLNKKLIIMYLVGFLSYVAF